MGTLDTLIRRQKFFVDEHRRVLADALAAMEQIQCRLAALEAEREIEAGIARESTDALRGYGAYLKEAMRRQAELEADLVAAEAVVEEARTQLAALFEEQKRYEIAAEQRVAAENAKNRRTETALMDEIGAGQHQRGEKE
jgi:flagellar export protein FliJ